jgi:hypothetical protein
MEFTPDPNLFNRSFGGGLQNAKSLLGIINERQKKSKLQEIASSLPQNDPYEVAGSKLIELGMVAPGLNTMNQPFARKLEQAKLSQLQNKPYSTLGKLAADFEAGRISEADYRAGVIKANKSGGVNVNINSGSRIPIPEYNKLQPGYVYKRDANGQILLTDGVPTAVPITGGPADIEAREKVDANAAKKQTTDRSANVVIQDIDRALDKLQSGVLPTTGLLGGTLSGVPGTSAHDAAELIKTISANTGFDRLQAMRDASKTGGALGAINATEMGLLQAALGNLKQSQSQQQLIDNLNRVRNIYMDIVHGPGNGGERRALSFESKNKNPEPKSKDGVRTTKSGYKFTVDQ